MSNPQPKRLYQVWKGSNRFFCGGRLIFGPDVASLFLSTLLIGGPAIAFCSKVISQIKDGHHAYPVLAVAVIVTVIDLIFLFLTSGRDPGIVPRNSRPPESEEMFDMTTPSMEWVNGRTPHLRLPRTKDVLVNGTVVKVKYCDTCWLYRPPRSSHCSICNNCVQRFDHHCPWVGQCIGLRNYRFFFLFISTSTFLCIYVFSFSWGNIIHEKEMNNETIWKTMSKDILSLVLIVYCFIAVWFVGGLTVFHLYLISTNQTTYENFRYRYDKKENPYNKGLVRNFKDMFFSRIPPSMNDFRSWVLEDPIEDHIEVGAGASYMGGDIFSQKGKIDIETGGTLAASGSMPVPDILQNLDYTGIDDNLKRNDGIEDREFDAFLFPVAHERGDSNQSVTESDGNIVDEGVGEGGGSNGSTTPIAHNIHIHEP
ncbi:putative protein S-acyltransferase 1 [Tasmannia lanceolata]|uniref:putative protein S-acyltransferase 1 n=1 Tax=Tasmannia lanceolata TaxID=3420 RepID=UPI004064193F